MDINIIDVIRNLNLLLCNKLCLINKDNLLSKYPSPLQVAIADYLYNNKNKAIYQKDLQEEFHVSKAAISDVVNSMEKKGIIRRETSLEDSRCNNIILTDLGIQCFKNIEHNNSLFNNKIINNISESDINKFISIINKIKNNIERDDYND